MWADANGKTFKFIHDIRREFPLVSFPAVVTDEVLESFGIVPVLDPGSPPADHTENVVEDPPIKVNGRWTRQWRKVPASTAEIDERTRAKTAEVMAVRDALIQAFFWSELLQPSVNAGQYRQHLDDLRDVTKQAGFPWTVTWPVKP